MLNDYLIRQATKTPSVGVRLRRGMRRLAVQSESPGIIQNTGRLFIPHFLNLRTETNLLHMYHFRCSKHIICVFVIHLSH